MGRVSQSAALRLVGMARSSWHYRHHPRARAVEVKPQRDRRSDRWLSDAEEKLIMEWLNTDPWQHTSAGEVYYVALDAGIYVASQRTWYRVAARQHLTRRPPRAAKYPPRAVPELVAATPNQVWSWDITKLPTPFTGQSYEFYVVIDLFSRYIVAHRVETVESDRLAKHMFTTAFDRLGVTPTIVHSDGGPSMTSKTLQQLFSDLTITTSRNRPRVSNDNPYSEAWFKTAKYHPGYPVDFHSLDQARTWADTFVDWYNTQHRHSGIAWHTPHSVYNGTFHQINHRRQTTLDTHHHQHPERYKNPPTAPELPIEAWINDPRRRLQTD
jgi:putative transposase